MKTQAQTQASRNARMSRLSRNLRTQYDPRKHRRAVRVAQAWIIGQGTVPRLLREVVMASYHFSHREFARVTRRAAFSA